jgi:hypothetical protein
MDTTVRDRVATGAMDWISAHLADFDPFTAGDEPSEFGQTVLAELSLCAHRLAARDIVRQHPHRLASITAWQAQISRIYTDPRCYEYGWRGHPHAISAHLLMWLNLSPAERDRVCTIERWQQLLTIRNWLSIEREPFRLLEVSYCLDLAGITHDLPSRQELAHRTFLAARQPCLVSINHEDIYALTHAIFYLTDFGLDRTCFTPERAAELLELTQNLLGMCLHAEHWDLVAELILIERCLSSIDSWWVETAWVALSQVQLTSGVIYQQIDTPTELTVDRFFAKYYHRTLVTIIAAWLGAK